MPPELLVVMNKTNTNVAIDKTNENGTSTSTRSTMKKKHTNEHNRSTINSAAPDPRQSDHPGNSTSPATAPTTTQEQTKQIITPHCNDVLSGRGAGINQHPGNECYRALIKRAKLNYLNTRPATKKKIIHDIIDAITTAQSPPGRFLKLDPKTGLWECITFEEAKKKTGQALREDAPKLRQLAIINQYYGGQGAGAPSIHLNDVERMVDEIRRHHHHRASEEASASEASTPTITPSPSQEEPQDYTNSHYTSSREFPASYPAFSYSITSSRQIAATSPSAYARMQLPANPTIEASSMLQHQYGYSSANCMPQMRDDEATVSRSSSNKRSFGWFDDNAKKPRRFETLTD